MFNDRENADTLVSLCTAEAKHNAQRLKFLRAPKLESNFYCGELLRGLKVFVVCGYGAAAVI